MMPGDQHVTLAIEISNPSMPAPGVAAGLLAGSGGPLGEEPVAPSTRTADDLTPAIDRLFARLGLAPAAIGRVVVSVGPGGYTSMRMAVAAGRMICLAVGARCAAVPSAEVAAVELALAGASGLAWPLAVVMAAKGERAFTTVVESAGPDGARVRGPGRVIDAAELAGLGVRAVAGDGHLPPSFVAEAGRLGIPVLASRLSARACLAAGASAPDIEPDRLVPLYAREPEAVTLWNARRAGPGGGGGPVVQL